MPSVEEVLKSEAIYFEEATISGISCSVGYIKKFRWTWFATQLNTFIIIGRTNNPVDKHTIESFSSDCLTYSLKNNKGWPRGLQAAVGSIAILQARSYNSSAIGFCENLTKKHWGAFEIPVLYDITQHKTIRYKKQPLWGKIYFPFFSKTIDEIAGRMGM